jgi:hypothetical protein
MKIYFVGPIFGNIQEVYDKIGKLSEIHGDPDWVIQLGNFGIWPDPHRIDRTTRLKGLELEFPNLYLNQTPVPYRTLFISGAHEDHHWLDHRRKKGHMDLVPNLTHLVNGYRTAIGDGTTTISVVGLGKVHSPKFYNSSRTDTRYYIRSEVERACSQGKVDLFISHASPNSKGIKDIVFATRPDYHMFAHESKIMATDQVMIMDIV